MHSQPTIRRCCTTRTPLCQRDACAQRACVNEVLAASKRALMATQTGRGAKEGSYRNLLRRAVCGKSCVSLTRKTSRQSLHAHETRGPTVTTIVCHTADSQGAQIGVPGQTLPPMPCPHSPPSLLCENDKGKYVHISVLLHPGTYGTVMTLTRRFWLKQPHATRVGSLVKKLRLFGKHTPQVATAPNSIVAWTVQLNEARGRCAHLLLTTKLVKQ
jgi:hypothetical protein